MVQLVSISKEKRDKGKEKLLHLIAKITELKNNMQLKKF